MENKIAEWTTKDGEKIPIDKLKDDHLKSILEMLYRKNYIAMSTFGFYLSCNPPDSDGAYDAFMSEFDYVTSKHPLAILDDLEQEAKKRGLKCTK